MKPIYDMKIATYYIKWHPGIDHLTSLIINIGNMTPTPLYREIINYLQMVFS